MPSYNIVYVATFLNQGLSNQFSLYYSPAGCKKKNHLIEIMSQRNRVRLIFVSCFSRFPGRYFRHQRMPYHLGINLEIPSFITIPFVNYLFNPISAFLGLVKLNRDEKIDVLVLYNLTYETVIPAVLMRYLTGVDIIVQMEDGVNPHFGFIKRHIGKFAEWLGVRASTGVMANSTNFFHAFCAKPSFLFRGLVKLGDFPLAQPSRANNKLINIVFSSTIDSIRGSELLAEFFKRTNSSVIIREANFVICGHGDKKCIENLLTAISIYKQKAGKANYLGFVSFDELLRTQQTADIFLSLQNPDDPFSWHCFPSKIFDYYGFNKPIIATKVSDIDGDPFFNNLIFVESNVEDFEAKLAHVILNIESYFSLASNNNKRLFDVFSLQKHEVMFDAFLMKILAR